MIYAAVAPIAADRGGVAFNRDRAALIDREIARSNTCRPSSRGVAAAAVTAGGLFLELYFAGGGCAGGSAESLIAPAPPAAPLTPSPPEPPIALTKSLASKAPPVELAEALEIVATPPAPPENPAGAGTAIAALALT